MTKHHLPISCISDGLFRQSPYDNTAILGLIIIRCSSYLLIMIGYDSHYKSYTSNSLHYLIFQNMF